MPTTVTPLKLEVKTRAIIDLDGQGTRRAPTDPFATGKTMSIPSLVVTTPANQAGEDKALMAQGILWQIIFHSP